MNRASPSPSLSGIPSIALLTVALVFCVAGCKDARHSSKVPSPTTVSSIASTSPVTTAAPPTTDPRPLIVCFGDSLTAGYGTNSGESYPEDLQRLLDAGGYHYRVLNSGISGNTTKDGLNRIARVIARHPQVVVVEFGGNDGLRGLPLEQTQSNLASMVEQLQDSGATVAIAGITLPPDYGPDYIKRFDAMYPALAKKYHVRFVPFLLQNVYGVPGDMQGDATHATAKGNEQVALNVEGLLEPLLKK